MGKSVLTGVVLSALLAVVHPPAQSSGTVRVDGAELRYLRMGQGPSLLVIGSSVSYPKAFSPSLTTSTSSMRTPGILSRLIQPSERQPCLARPPIGAGRLDPQAQGGPQPSTRSAPVSPATYG